MVRINQSKQAATVIINYANEKYSFIVQFCYI